MRKLCMFLIILIMNMSILKAGAADLNVSSENYILYNLNDNKVIYEKDSEEKISVASLTKIMTAVIVLDNVKNLDEEVILLPEDFKGLIEANLATAGFVSGQKVTYRGLLYGLLLPSGADAANSLARLVGKNEDNFVKMMNEKANKLNLKNTHFVNTTGLDAENHYSTVSDIAKLFEYALKNDDFKNILQTKSYVTSDKKIKINNSVLGRAKNLNMDYLLGGKVGVTDGAGLCLASIASKNGTNYMLITAGAPFDNKGPHHFKDSKTIYEYFMNNYSYQTVVNKNDILLTLKTEYTKNDKLDIKSNKNLNSYLPNNFDKSKIKYDYNGKEIITSKMNKGEKLGTLTISYDNNIIDKIDIVLEEKQEFSLVKYLEDHIYLLILPLIVIILLIVIKKRKNIKA